MAGLSAEIGRKIMDAVDHHRGEAADHTRLADDIDDAWKQHDFTWLWREGVLNTKDMKELGLVTNGRRKKRTSRRRR